MKHPQKKIPVILIVTGILLVAASVYFYIATERFIEDARTTTGEVIALVDIPADIESSGGVLYAPVIKFTTEEETTITFQSTHAANPTPYDKGDTVAVLYTPGDPGSARVHDFISVWLAPLVSLFLGICFLVAAGWKSRGLPLFMISIMLLSCGGTDKKGVTNAANDKIGRAHV